MISVSQKNWTSLHFQVIPTNLVQHQQFMVLRIDIKIFTY